MIAESISILAITLCLIVVFVRTGHGDYALSTVPLLIVPAVHLVAIPMVHVLCLSLPRVQPLLARACFDIGALAISCLCIVLLSVKVKNKKNKQRYIVVLSIYNIILTCSFVMQTIQPML